MGIKFEAARVGGVDGPALAKIGEQLRDEVGEGWETDEGVLRGRNAVRREHGLPRLGEPAERPPDPEVRRPMWRKFLGR